LIEPISTIGIGAITVLQLANLYQARQTAQKVDSMVTKEQYKEDAATAGNKCREYRDKIKEDIEHTNIRLMHHQHNGDDVKITKV